ncbi:MAG TPA: DNA recombination protein RmuC [Burkholderiaceae bacterium]|nr:DNA recombination protein RmuC [Burkholderiaceae bacterium]
MTDALFPILILVALIAVVALQLVLVFRSRNASADALLAPRLEAFERAQERTERELRDAIAQSAQGQRTELGQTLERVAQSLNAQLATNVQLQNQQIDAFGLQLARFGEQQQSRIRELTEANERRLGEIRATLEQKIAALQTDNAAKLDEMRRTVDEKLHATLEQRLGESFRLVSERLEAVQRGLGEMHSLAQGVGDLKRVLTNVKTRGAFGEVQLATLLENLLTPEQYERNVVTRPGSNERVEFAVRMPGPHADQPLRMPIDAKFPVEDYERLLAAHEAADVAGMEAAAKALEARIRLEAKTIAEKYLEPPHTTDFAILFVPTEGLYAEVLRRPGLFDELQRRFRVTVAGPTTLSAMLNALQMGFRTLAIEKRSSEVWTLLGAVKTEFGKFGEILEKSESQLQTVLNTMQKARGKTTTIARRLRGVQALPGPQANEMLDAPDMD